jgi:cytochrome P450
MTIKSFNQIPLDPRSVLRDFGVIQANRSAMLARMETIAQTYGDIVRLKSIGRHLVFINHPDLLQQVFIDRAQRYVKSAGVRATKRLVGNGLLTSEGEFHLRQRRLVQPAFHRQRIANLGSMMVEYSLTRANTWSAAQPFDIYHEMTQLTMHVVAKALFNANVAASEQVGNAIDFLIRHMTVLDGSPIGIWLSKLPTPFNRTRQAKTTFLQQVVRDFIAAGRARQQDIGDLLSILLESQDTEGDGTGMSDQQIADEVMTLFVAGHETTANWLTWSFYELGQRPELQAKVRAEVQQVVGDRLPSAADYPNLKYTRQFLSEVLRLYPPVFVVGRETCQPDELGGYLLPRGTSVLLSPWVIQRDARYWDEPLAFKPERFAGEHNRPKFSFIPFGGGSRVCIGEGFAWQEAVLVLSTVLQKWDVRYAGSEPVGFSPQVTLRPKSAVLVQVTPAA